MYKRRMQGSYSIEFVGCFFVLAWILAFLIELIFMTYISALGNYALAAGVRVTKANLRSAVVSNDGYKRKIEMVIKNNLIDSYFLKNYRVGVKYYSSLNNLLNTVEKGSSIAKSKPLALYWLEINYTPIFNFWLTPIIFRHEIVAVQEYEKEQNIGYQ